MLDFRWFFGAMAFVLILLSIDSVYRTYTINQCKLAYAATNRKTEDIRQICKR